MHVQTKKLQRELCQSEVRREEAERKAARTAEKVMRLSDVASQMEETRGENESLNTQVYNYIFIKNVLQCVTSINTLLSPCLSVSVYSVSQLDLINP